MKAAMALIERKVKTDKGHSSKQGNLENFSSDDEQKQKKEKSSMEAGMYMNGGVMEMQGRK